MGWELKGRQVSGLEGSFFAKARSCFRIIIKSKERVVYMFTRYPHVIGSVNPVMQHHMFENQNFVAN